MRKTRIASKSPGRTGARVKAAQKGRGELRIGISGWRYAGWRGVFYPKDLPQRRELEFASRSFNSIEINGSFYSLQRPESYQRWHSETPEDFVFSVKGPRFITHMKRLREVEAPLSNFFASGILALGAKLGPILWQLPPSFKWDRDRLEKFFRLLPRDTREASRLARRHDTKLKTKPWIAIDRARPLRYAIEVRHPTFLDPEFIELLREQDVGFVIADTAGKWPYAEDITAGLVYIRLHGDEKLYVSGYSDSALNKWARRIRCWRRGRRSNDTRTISLRRDPVGLRDVFVYFDNDAKVHAPFDAIALRKKLVKRQNPRRLSVHSLRPTISGADRVDHRTT